MTVTRGTTNGNARGSSYARTRRRAWLQRAIPTALSQGIPACRCYRCGVLLTAETLTVDRIIPGALGGTYRRTNIRPACGPCNSETGGAVRSRRTLTTPSPNTPREA